MRIVFVRHGDPDYAHDCLTEKGLIQARQAAVRLREEGIEEIWSSPMGRAQQTAAAASEELGLPVKTLDFMHELNWGSTNGEPLFSNGHPWDIADELARQNWNLNRADWAEHPYFKNNIVTENVRQVEEGIDRWLEGLGYVRDGFYYRSTLPDNRQRTVALFSHGGSSAAAMGHILNLPFPYVCALLHLEFTGITIIRMDRNPGAVALPCLELGNDGRHIHGTSYHRLADM